MKDGAFFVCVLFLGWTEGLCSAQHVQLVRNGGFEDGLSGWKARGAVHLETNAPLAGRVSACIGPGGGALSQRIETGSGNPITLSALVEPGRSNGWVFAARFLDASGRELMRVDSLHDLEPKGNGRLTFDHYMQPHPLTKWIELTFSNALPEGTLTVDQVGLDMPDENAANLRPECDLEQAMQPFWLGRTVINEAVLMVSEQGKPATGRLLFQPSRILSVRDYSLVTNYAAGVDYNLKGRTLTCTANSSMPQIRKEDLPHGELKWGTFGGKQAMVTYEHEDHWNDVLPAFDPNALPETLMKLKARARLTVVAYGDSITHGYGESRLSHIRPFLPPWPELVMDRLEKVYGDKSIQFYNSSQSGADSIWGRDYAGRMAASLKPDLVIIAFGQNDFWRIPAGAFAQNIADIIKTVRQTSQRAEFLLVSPLRFDPAYTSKSEYWNRVGEYASRLRAMACPGIAFVDMTAISERVYAAKKPRDCLNDPLHPNDYFARWYAQSVAATLIQQGRPSAPLRGLISPR